MMTDFPIAKAADIPPALVKAQPGDTLTFGAGSYGGFKISGLRFAAPGVTLRAALGAHVTTGPIVLDSAAGITIQGLEIATGDAVGIAFSGANPERLVIRDCDIHGAIVPPAQIALKGGIAIAMGAAALDCTVDGCDIHHVGAGMNAVGCSNLTITNNKIHDLVGDGIHIVPYNGLLIEMNVLGPFYAALAVHNDAIQLDTAGAKARPTNIAIRRNRITRGTPDGCPVQAIFSSDSNIGYSKITIAENVISTGNWWGIGVVNATDVSITDNFIAGDKGALSNGVPMVPYMSARNCTGVVATGNTVPPNVAALALAGDFSAADAVWAKLIAPPPMTPSERLAAISKAVSAEPADPLAKAVLAILAAA